MKVNTIGRKTIHFMNQTVNTAVLTIIMLLISFSGYALWDSNQLHFAADKSHYAIYKPSIKDGGKSFKELQALNAEVIAWLTVYGTNIDYPVTQGPDNMKYVDMNAEGRYSLSGSIFLDSNNKDFSDYNSILHGHHMAKKVMFGEIGSFSDKKYFDVRQYGSLYFNEKDHGIEFFAFLHEDAYDLSVYTPNIKEADRQEYLENILTKAIHTRDIGITTDDRIVLLSTCSSNSTNGRDVLIGRITYEAYEDIFLNTRTNDGKSQNNQGGLLQEVYLLNILLILLLIVLISVIYNRRKHEKGVEKND